MRNKTIFLVIMVVVLLAVSPALLLAAQKTVTITWTTSGVTDVQDYNVYLADNSSMLNQTLLTDCAAPSQDGDRYTITCPNVELAVNQTYYLTVVAQLADNSELASNVGSVENSGIMPATNLRIVSQ